MKTTISFLRRVQCVLLLSTILVCAGCTEGPLGGDQNTEQEGSTTISLGEVTATTATFSGHMNVATSDLSFSQVTIYYSDAETFHVNEAETVTVT